MEALIYSKGHHFIRCRAMFWCIAPVIEQWLVWTKEPALG